MKIKVGNPVCVYRLSDIDGWRIKIVKGLFVCSSIPVDTNEGGQRQWQRLPTVTFVYNNKMGIYVCGLIILWKGWKFVGIMANIFMSDMRDIEISEARELASKDFMKVGMQNNTTCVGRCWEEEIQTSKINDKVDGYIPDEKIIRHRQGVFLSADGGEVGMKNCSSTWWSILHFQLSLEPGITIHMMWRCGWFKGEKEMKVARQG